MHVSPGLRREQMVSDGLMTLPKRAPKTASPTRGQFPQRAVVENAVYEKSRPRREIGGRNYFKELLIEPNLSFIVVPRLFTTVMIASAMPAAIRPYSIAVAPDSSDQNFETMRFKTRLRFSSRVYRWIQHPEIYGAQPSVRLTGKPQVIRKSGTKVPQIEINGPLE